MDDPLPPPSTDSVPSPGSPAPTAAPGQSGLPGWLEALLAAKATTAFLIAVGLIFFLEWRDPGTQTLRLPFAPEVYVKFGGYDYATMMEKGQYWRFMSALFVPRWGIDAFIYLFLFFQMGPELEKILGTFRFCVLYLVAGATGVAVGALVDPSGGTYGTILVVYALLGGVPGTILGVTGSLSKTLGNPGARGAMFHLLFWLVLGYFVRFGSFAGSVTTAVTAMALGAALGGWRRNPGAAVAKAVIPLAFGLACMGAVINNMRWLDGGLVSRDGIRPGGRTSNPNTPTEIEQPTVTPEGVRKSEGASAAEPYLERIGSGLDRYGPLPTGEGLSDDDYDAVRGWLLELEAAIRDPDTLILSELDGLRVRCLVLLARHDEAVVLGDEFLSAMPSPQARALVGVAYFFKAGQSEGAAAQKAERYLSSALLERGLDVELPEARYFYGVLLYQAHQDAESLREFEKYLALVGSDESSQPAFRAPLVRQAKIQLDR